MADQKDQDPNPPANPTFIPLSKGSMAEKSLPGRAREPESESESESESSDSSSDEEISGIEFKKMKVEELRKKAYYSVLKAFKTETNTVSDKRNQIIQRLMKEWEISQETYKSVSDSIEKDLLFTQDKGMQSSGSSWGNVKPESLVGKSIRLRYSEEDPFDELLIKDYDSIMERHLLVKPDGTDMEMSDVLNYIDIRTIPASDIIWQGDEKPDFNAPQSQPKLSSTRIVK